MKPLSLPFAVVLAVALSVAAVAETANKPRKKPALNEETTSDDATPRPRKKTPLRTPAPAEDEATPRPRRKTPSPTPEPEATPGPNPEPPASSHAPAATLAPEDLREFAGQPPRVQQLITAALALTKLNLTYTYGSDEPARGGMDCSGTMAYLLRSQGFGEVPRDSSGQYAWVRKRGEFFAVVSKSAAGFEFDDLRPGDLLFWTGTYQVSRDIPISHVMLYLGTEAKTKKPVMFGASDGRSYAGIQRWGVSVFDFKMPTAATSTGERTKVDFVGYGRIPDLRGATAEEPAAATPTPVPETMEATPQRKSGSRPAATPGKARKKKPQ